MMVGMTDLWPAPTADRPVRALVRVPGSKSQTARELVLAALADEPSVLHGALRSRDSLLMARALQALGATIVDPHGRTIAEDAALVTPASADPPAVDGEQPWHVTPGPVRAGGTVDCGLAGTVMRFLPPVAALAPGAVVFRGDEQAGARPIRGLLRALTDLGIDVTLPEQGSVPFTVHGTGEVAGGQVSVQSAESSQFLSGLLLAGFRYQRGLIVEAAGAVPSRPHIDMTLSALQGRGLDASVVSDNTWRVGPGRARGGEVQIEPDLSNAAPFLAAAMVTGGEVTVPAWPQTSLQPGHDLPRLLRLMGASVDASSTRLTVTGPAVLRGLGTVDMSHAGELVPTLTALCALADSPTEITGVAHLRGHETDRLAALRTELSRMGGRVQETGDGLRIDPASLHGARFETYHDHRMATTAAVLALRVPGVQVVDVATTAKTLPDFVGRWQAMLA